MLNALRLDDLSYSNNLAIDQNCKGDLPSYENCGAILPSILWFGRGSMILKSLRPFNAPSLLVSNNKGKAPSSMIFGVDILALIPRKACDFLLHRPRT